LARLNKPTSRANVAGKEGKKQQLKEKKNETAIVDRMDSSACA
jgi:hypothetical protein